MKIEYKFVKDEEFSKFISLMKMHYRITRLSDIKEGSTYRKVYIEIKEKITT